jgi:hypothetical protein
VCCALAPNRDPRAQRNREGCPCPVVRSNVERSTESSGDRFEIVSAPADLSLSRPGVMAQTRMNSRDREGLAAVWLHRHAAVRHRHQFGLRGPTSILRWDPRSLTCVPATTADHEQPEVDDNQHERDDHERSDRVGLSPPCDNPSRHTVQASIVHLSTVRTLAVSPRPAVVVNPVEPLALLSLRIRW